MNSHLRDILIGSLTNEIAEVYDVDRRLVNLLAYTTYQSRAISANTESLSGFVNNWKRVNEVPPVDRASSTTPRRLGM